jgi:hypothetical protein
MPAVRSNNLDHSVIQIRREIYLAWSIGSCGAQTARQNLDQFLRLAPIPAGIAIVQAGAQLSIRVRPGRNPAKPISLPGHPRPDSMIWAAFNDCIGTCGRGRYGRCGCSVLAKLCWGRKRRGDDRNQYGRGCFHSMQKRFGLILTFISSIASVVSATEELSRSPASLNRRYASTPTCRLYKERSEPNGNREVSVFLCRTG